MNANYEIHNSMLYIQFVSRFIQGYTIISRKKLLENRLNILLQNIKAFKVRAIKHSQAIQNKNYQLIKF